MEYFDFKGKQLSRLGFGAMRLPIIGTDAGAINQDELNTLIAEALQGGINYFDTAYSYHLGNSEAALGKALSAFPRESYYLADKFPGHEIRKVYKPEVIFQEQLDRVDTDHFDFYLMHNITELSIDTYLDSRWNIVDYFIEQKEAGRITRLGFSAHGTLETIKRFMERYGEHMEFCQLQINYLDWSLQNAQEKYDYINNWNIPVWVMEPLRGGKLSSLSEKDAALLSAVRDDEDAAALAFRWVQKLDNVGVILSGMGDHAILAKNIASFSDNKDLTQEEFDAIEAIGANMLDFIPCTKCRYCVHHCPMMLDIPRLIELASEARMGASYTIRMAIDALPEEARPDACLSCGECTMVCPQNIEIPALMEQLAQTADQLVPWAELRKYDD